ncbi:MAG TPA: ATP-binding protein [Acidobacteriaceae bacterium]|jgi:PAS domain S-box-containing protein|nr:ATP-binding protein [Acidobacteriaceae bacterium]
MNDRAHPLLGERTSGARAESQLRLLVDTGLLLARERDLDIIVQAALNAGLQLSDAAFGAFFYNNIGSDGSPYQLYKLSGRNLEAFAAFPAPRPTQVFAESFVNKRILRSGDITKDPRYGHNRPLSGMPPDHPPVRSYLSVPVLSRSSETLGALIYGHPEANVFSEAIESLVATVATQAAVAIDNARLADNLTREIAQTDAARQLQRETADRLQQVLDATTDGILVLDHRWRVSYINRHAQEIIAPGRDLAGSPVWDIFPGVRGTVLEQRCRRAMNDRETVRFTEFYDPLQIWADIRIFPTAEGIAIFFQNVTQQRQAQRELVQSERRLRQALDAGQLGTWSWNADTDMLDLDETAAQLFHTQPHTPVNRTQLRQRIVHPEDRGPNAFELRDILKRGGIYSAEYRLQNPDGSQSWVAASGVATFRDDSAEIAGLIGTVQDITARKTQEATLRQSEKLAATGRLAATIAHEINNPLEAVTNLIYLSKTDPAVPPPIQHLLESADGELARVAQIAQQTLGFYRDTARPGEVDLTALLHGIVSLFSRKLDYKKLTCRLDIDPGLRVFGLQGEIRQVFSNLLVNAIDASKSGEICIRARHLTLNGEGCVSVLLVDHGSGIPPQIRERLFSPFFTTKESLGTGLGLWVTRGMVEKHGGTIAFRTRTIDPSGTVFRVVLPVSVGRVDAFSFPSSEILQ